ncbi:hypothetical protein V5O48_007110 [Marasmius crinis-equi]|uniref:KOW domain-containing protein n=1 Tax=Marasmius crinis-equi TaxID=585013 RepID=A0ABR3FHL2_9AGAR
MWFVNLEAQVAESSEDDEEQIDDNDDFIDEEVDLLDDYSRDRTHGKPMQELGSHRQPSGQFLDELERRYVNVSSSRDASSSTLDCGTSVLGKRKTPDTDPAFQQQILSHLSRHPPPDPAPCSPPPRGNRPINRMTRMPLPRREQPIVIPDERRLLRTYSTSTELFGDPWISEPPPSVTPQKRSVHKPSNHSVKHQHLRNWISWAKKEGRKSEYAPGEWVIIRRGTYKGDVGQIWKAKTREKTETEMDAEREAVEQAARAGEPAPEITPELAFEGYWVFLVPRLPPPYLTEPCSLRLKSKRPKRSPRFPPRQFIPGEYDMVLLKRNNNIVQGYSINGHLLSRGLLMKVYRVDALDPCALVPADTQLLAFQDHPFCKQFPLPLTDMWCFSAGDEVEVESSSTLASPQSGRGVVSVCAERMILVDFGDAGIHPTRIELLTKVISISDYVRILRGPHASREGLVVERHGNTLAVSERGSRKGIDLFVHVNTVSKVKHEPVENSSIPWLNKEVTIFRGPHANQTGIVKDVRRKPNRVVLFLWLFLPEQSKIGTCLSKGTAVFSIVIGKVRSDYQRYYHIERIGNTKSGPIPWIGTYVGIIKGQHKGKEGTVKDVNRTTKPSAISGLMVTVELNVYGTSRLDEQIYYDYIRERSTGLTLATHEPLINEQCFYAPNPAFVPSGVIWEKGKTLFLLLDEEKETNVDAIDDEVSKMLNASTDQIMDVWNPYWSYPSDEVIPSSPTLPSPSGTLQSTTSNVVLPPTHWLSHPELLGLTLLVDIKDGPHAKLNQYVELVECGGVTVARVRKGKAKRSYDIPLSCVGKSSKRPNVAKEENLLVVAGGQQPQHIGKLVRRVHHFYEGSIAPENRWLIVAVVDREDRVQKLTGEIVECKLHDLEFVEEAGTDRFRATHVFMRRVRDEARLHLSADIRGPGSVNLDHLRNCISSHMSAYHGTGTPRSSTNA